MLLPVPAMRAVASHEMQRRIGAFEVEPHHRHVMLGLLVKQRAGLRFTQDEGRHRIARAEQPHPRRLRPGQRDQFRVRQAPQGVALLAHILDRNAGQVRMWHHLRRMGAEIAKAEGLQRGIVDVDPVVGEARPPQRDQRHRDERAVTQRARREQRDGCRAQRVAEVGNRTRGDDGPRANGKLAAVGRPRGRRPQSWPGLVGQRLERVAHQDPAALLPRAPGGGVPQHARAPARIAQRLRGLPEVWPRRRRREMSQRRPEGRTQFQVVERRAGPLRGNRVALRADGLLDPVLEQDLEEMLAEGVAPPVPERPRAGNRGQLRGGEGQQAGRRLSCPEAAQSLDGREGMRLEHAVAEGARRERALHEIVRQKVSPELLDRAGARREAVAAGVEQETLVVDGAADAADRARIALDHDDVPHGRGQEAGCRQSCRACSDNQHVGFDAGELAHGDDPGRTAARRALSVRRPTRCLVIAVGLPVFWSDLELYMR